MTEPRRSVVGKIGLALSLLPWVGDLSTRGLRPGWDSPQATFAGFLILFGPPVAFIVSLVGCFTDTARKQAVAGALISAGTFVVLFLIGL
jgi:hypothetical protein